MDICLFFRSVNNVGFALKELLQRADKSDKVVVGVMECVQILQSNPDEVNLCILTETGDVTAQIHHKLVEAFCWENDIEVIKVICYCLHIYVLNDLRLL